MARKKARGGQSRRDAVEGITQAAYATRKKVTRQAIAKAVASGRIPTLQGTRKRIDPKVADRALRDNADPARAHRRGGRRNDDADGPDGVPSYNESRRIREHHLAKLAELEHLEKSAQLLRAEEVNEERFRTGRHMRDQILAVPSRLAPTLTGVDDQSKVFEILTEEMRQLCEQLADHVLATAAVAPPPQELPFDSLPEPESPPAVAP